MARPVKKGFDYFPFDVDFFEDIKIKKIAKRCGITAALAVIYIFCLIYKDEGYYLKVDEDTVFFISEKMGISEEDVQHILEEAANTGLFDKSLYEYERILTSKGIQRRWVSMRTNKSRRGDIDTRYMLDFPKITKHDNEVIGEKKSNNEVIKHDNEVIGVNNEVIQHDKYTKKRKEKKSKEKEIKEKSTRASKQFVPPTVDEIRQYVTEKGYNVNPQVFFDYFDVRDWVDSNDKPVKNWKQKVITWSSYRGNNVSASQPKAKGKLEQGIQAVNSLMEKYNDENRLT